MILSEEQLAKWQEETASFVRDPAILNGNMCQRLWLAIVDFSETVADLKRQLAERDASNKPANLRMEGPCGTAAVNTSTSEDTHPTAKVVSPSEELLLLPESEWERLSPDSRGKVRKWFDLAEKYLQAILDERLFDIKKALKASNRAKVPTPADPKERE